MLLNTGFSDGKSASTFAQACSPELLHWLISLNPHPELVPENFLSQDTETVDEHKRRIAYEIFDFLIGRK